MIRHQYKPKRKPKARSRQTKATIPVVLRRREECEYKWKEYNILNQIIGKGSTSNVQKLCDDKKHCPFVLRVEEMKRGLDRFLEEVLITQLASDNNIGPKLYDAWYCFDEKEKRDFGFMVMDRWEGDLRSLEKYPFLGDLDLNDMFSEIETKMKKLHGFGFVHGDLWAGNVLFRKHGNKFEFALVDFDRTAPLQEVGKYVLGQELKAFEQLKRSVLTGNFKWSGYHGMEIENIL